MPEKERFGKVIEQTLNIKNGLALAGVPVTATAAQLNAMGGLGAAAAGAVFNRITKVAVVALAAVDTAGGVFSWANPEATAILVTRLVVDVTTVATAACTLDIGATATTATTLSDTMLDGIDVHTATGQFDSMLAANAGTNGLTVNKVAVGKWVTASKASGASAGLVGFAYIFYSLI